MQSKKRFTETAVWDDPFFMDLTPNQKLLWFYIHDRCDNIGLWKPNWRLALFQLAMDVKDIEVFAKGFLGAVNADCERVIVFDDYWFLPDFIRFQYCQSSPLNPRNPAHRSYVKLIHEKEMVQWFTENRPEILPPEEIEAYRKIHPLPALNSDNERSPRGLKEVSERHKDKEKEKDQEKEEEKDQEKETGTDKEQGKGTPPDTIDDPLHPTPALGHLPTPADFEREQMREREARMNELSKENGLPF